MTENTPQPRRKRLILFTFLGLLAACACLTGAMILPYLLAVVMGGILALITKPLYRRLLGYKFRPKYAAIVTTTALTLLIIGPVLAFAAVAVDQAIEVANKVSASEGFSMPAIHQRLLSFKTVRTLVGDAAAIDQQVKSSIRSAGKTASTFILGAVSLLPNFFLQLTLALIACFFLLIDGEKLFEWMKNKLPLDADVRARLVNSFKETAVSTIWATMAAATAQAIIMFTAYLSLGVPAPFLAAGATFFLAWVPLVGSTPVWLGGAVYLYSQGAVVKAVLMLLFGFATGISDNFVYPIVLKGKANMHPLVGLVAIFGGIQMFGIFGVFIGPILAAVMISFLDVWPEIQVRFGLRDPEQALDQRA